MSRQGRTAGMPAVPAILCVSVSTGIRDTLQFVKLAITLVSSSGLLSLS